MSWVALDWLNPLWRCYQVFVSRKFRFVCGGVNRSRLRFEIFGLFFKNVDACFKVIVVIADGLFIADLQYSSLRV
jgi:hypothetical protein